MILGTHYSSKLESMNEFDVSRFAASCLNFFGHVLLIIASPVYFILFLKCNCWCSIKGLFIYLME